MGRINRILNDPGKYLSLDHILNNVIGGRLFLFWMRISKWIQNDEFYIRVFYRLAMKERLDLKNPVTYTQKIQWLKLHNTNPMYSRMVDKYAAKEMIAKAIGQQYVIPLLGVWDSFDAIDFSKMPNQFVLKTTHDSGNVIVCKDKKHFDIAKARKKLSKALKTNYFYKSREYPYKNAVPRIIAEKYMYDKIQEELTDFKFFCFHDEPRVLQISSHKGNTKKVSYYDMEFSRLHLATDLSGIDDALTKPDNFCEMIEIARRLSKGLIHVRIDLYSINGQIFFGEYTFHNSGGIVNFNPPEWNKILGDMIVLPVKNISSNLEC
jgi:hypothetical protein